MELLFVVLIGVLAGLAARGVLPRRELTGVVLLPAIGGVSAAIVWVALTWVGLEWDGGWIWAVTVAACVLSVVGGGALLARARRRDDEALFERLARGGTAATAVRSARTR